MALEDRLEDDFLPPSEKPLQKWPIRQTADRPRIQDDLKLMPDQCHPSVVALGPS